MDKYIEKLKEIIDITTTVPNKDNKRDVKKFFKKNKFDDAVFSAYKYFLLNYGNCYIKDDYYFETSDSSFNIKQEKFEIDTFFNLENIKKYALDYSDIIQNGFLPIAEIVGGDLVCIEKNTGEIWFWFHDVSKDNFLKVSNSFGEFICGFQFSKQMNNGSVKMNLSPELDAFLKEASKNQNE
ncbi:MAG: SMI1/KNR4 family protein [Eubacterium sp.]|nr:SMI1/KNR4 family protein [Eubacterium sp.]